MKTFYSEAALGKTGRTVLPGHPLGVKYMAETDPENPVRCNQVRGMNGYTGYDQGRRAAGEKGPANEEREKGPAAMIRPALWVAAA